MFQFLFKITKRSNQAYTYLVKNKVIETNYHSWYKETEKYRMRVVKDVSINELKDQLDCSDQCRKQDGSGEMIMGWKNIMSGEV